MTGGHSKIVQPLCESEIEIDPTLILKGLILLLKKN